VDRRKTAANLSAYVVRTGREERQYLVQRQDPPTTLTNFLPTTPPDESTFLKVCTGITYSSRKERPGFLIWALNARIGESLSRWETLGALTTSPIPVAFVSVSHDSMAHRRRQIGSTCTTRRVMGLLQPPNANQRPPAQKVDLMVSSVSRPVLRHRSSSSPPIENGLPRGRLLQEEPHPGRLHIRYPQWRASNRGIPVHRAGGRRRGGRTGDEHLFRRLSTYRGIPQEPQKKTESRRTRSCGCTLPHGLP